MKKIYTAPAIDVISLNIENLLFTSINDEIEDVIPDEEEDDERVDATSKEDSWLGYTDYGEEWESNYEW